MSKQIIKASKISNGALSSFRKAHDDLVKANSLVDGAVEHHKAEQERIRNEAAERLAEHDGHLLAAQQIKQDNTKVITKLKDFLG